MALAWLSRKRWPNEVGIGMAKRIWNVLRQTVVRWTRNDGNLLAASMAYYAAFSLFPLLLVLLAAIGFALRFSTGAQSARQQLLDFLSQSAGPELAREVESLLAQVLAQVETRASFSGWIGLVTLLVGAIGIFSQLESAFDRLWQDTTPHRHGIWAAVRNALWNRLKAFLTLVGLGIVVIGAFIADLMLTGVRTWADNLPNAAWFSQGVQLVFSVTLNAFVLSLVYRMIPRASVCWRHAACGGVTVAVIWQLGSQLVARFIVGGNYSAYGVVGSFIAIMLWVYCASILLFLGGQLVQVLGHPEEGRPREPGAGQ
jgi:membrane protein